MKLGPQPPPPPKKKDLWHQVVSGELLQASLKLTPDGLHSAIDATRDVGRAISKSFHDIKDHLRTAFDLPVVEEVVKPETRERISEVAVTVASGVGYAAAGIQGLVGVAKLINGFETKNSLKKLEGCLDLTTAAAIGTYIAGAAVAPLILGPVAASLNLVRGGAVALAGYRKGDTRAEVQGLLDSTRSAAIMGTILRSQSAVLSVSAAVCGPIAGAIQFSRGFIDLRDGLKEKTSARQLQGLCDIGSAIGLTLASTGVGTIPGVVLTGLSVGTKLLYQLSDRFEAATNRKLEKHQGKLSGGIKLVEKVWNPVLTTVRAGIKKLTGVDHGAPDDPPEPK